MYHRHKVVFVGSLSVNVQTQVLVNNRTDSFLNLTKRFKGKSGKSEFLCSSASNY